MTGFLIRRGKLDTNTHTGKTRGRHREKTAPYETKRKTKTERRNQPADTRISAFWPAEL